MKPIATTKMSSKGQVVIPESIRDLLNLEAGTQFVVIAEDDVVILKMIKPPSMEDFDEVISKARKQAKEAGLTPLSAAETIAQYRKSR
ncbi:MAG: AbrB/MazE/SpoVT family DNA-binding domain-containing protein [bacterium]|nr:AbrB/MazE/SpoVT family DNA-binding domain-containing protein [bacterium]